MIFVRLIAGQPNDVNCGKHSTWPLCWPASGRKED